MYFLDICDMFATGIKEFCIVFAHLFFGSQGGRVLATFFGSQGGEAERIFFSSLKNNNCFYKV